MLNYMIEKLYRLGELKSYFEILSWKEAIIMTALELFNKTKIIKVHIKGIDIKIRTCCPDFKVARDALVYGEYDDIELDNPQIIIDLGANIGTSAIALSRKFPDATILAVEMEKNNFEMLKENVSQFEKVIPIHAAIASSDGIRSIYDRGTGAWGYTIAKTSSGGINFIEKVEALSLDTLIDRFNINMIDLLKIDIEGAEKDIFKNGGKWLSITNSIIIELHDYIVMGASKEFYIATEGFSRFKQTHEKILAYK